ncbi:CamS family sex pheromone protein [Bacillus sp. FJAT-50079]|uniref:CamS family sex pheromone protein n=1 Tax=Bacillus sp. FJAT-50079 TaxID=2833577 RepID=UPI001BC97DB9|nr:CamS family sex pheromone protein [Bacillus sp. FJAT-50079]
MKKWLIPLLAVTLLTGCLPAFEGNNEVVQEKEELEETSIIPSYQISDSYYRSIVSSDPITSKTRGMVVSNLYSKYDIDEFEKGLLRVAKENFSPDEYVFQEGQVLDRDTVSSWLNRKYTEEQLAERKLSEKDNVGLNPLNDGEGSVEEQNTKNPIYLAHILEHDYLVKSENTVKLGGIVIGLALNSVHYYQKEKYGATFEMDIPHEKLVEEGKKMAQEVYARLRAMEEVGDIPITIALFEQKGRNTIAPGTFFAYSHASNGSSLGDWKNIDEKYLILNTSEAEQQHPKDVAFFMRFKDDIEKYFPNYNGIIGRAFYKNDQLINLTIDITIQFFGETEVIGFTQWATSLVMDHMPDYINVDVNISSVNGAEALIVKKAGEKEPYVHIY